MFHGRKTQTTTIWDYIVIVFAKSLSDAHADNKFSEIYVGNGVTELFNRVFFPLLYVRYGIYSQIVFKKPETDFLMCKVVQVQINLISMKKVNKQCLLDTPRTVRVSEKTWQVIVQTRRP